MTVKQQSDHGVIEKVCHLRNGIFHSINLCHTSQFYSITSLVLFTKHNKLWNERKEGFLYMAASTYHIISEEVENRVFKHDLTFRRTLYVISNPY